MTPRDRAQSPEPSPGDDVGGYVLKALLGQGGFGTVYLAERGGQRYALKLLPLAGLGGWGERELLMLARVKHPNVVRLLGHSHWPDAAPRFLVIVMEYVEGRRLDVWADTENPSAHAVLLRVRGVARALRALHEGKALHRDVKEANVLVREADGEAVLVDLGVGGHEDTSRITGGSLPPGTRAYLSPEAWRFHQEHQGSPDAHYRSTPADDLYALGVVLYWLLTGRRPFHLGEPGDEAAVISRAPVAPHVRDARVPEELGALCLSLLEKRPEHRPDAAALLAKVEELLAREAPEWHVPLCDFHDAHNVTTRPGPGADEEAAWLNEVREDVPPRRGRRPPRLSAELESAVGSAAPVLAPLPLIGESTATHARVPSAPKMAERPPVEAGALAPRATNPGRTSWSLLVLGLLAVLCGAVAFQDEARSLPFPRGGDNAGPVRKVAPPEQQPESNGAAAPPEAAPTPAVIASPAMPPKEPAPVMMHTPAGTSPQPERSKKRGASGRTLKAAATACALLGCPGAQVRGGKPPPEPCPPGAIETMKALGIYVGDTEAWTFGGGNRILTVHEGWTSVFLPGSDFGDIPNGSMLSGRLLFGDRVYGRITQARLEGTDRIVPVCMELMDTGGDLRGLDIEPGSSPTAARVWSFGYIKAVRSFE
ncbi:serine/threonine-protein kinase [Myxococcus sp. RHSTA-1-4]|uniref:serine/threonine-protein kinase n=1 Tax=Myxococcus sp. RHSTA-1-4 TaxID=2874601 RepID=UPI001CBEDE79|nr:serine/threonine-protein kinase [Myxococcus sp. RHSTA-1-4]MBZ4421535.1 serine/threonine protein kinase [Myxococcus sp. RHSTA-1-4]